jgi:hypothetical protein
VEQGPGKRPPINKIIDRDSEEDKSGNIYAEEDRCGPKNERVIECEGQGIKNKNVDRLPSERSREGYKSYME